MADDEASGGGKRKKPAPPGVRIRASDEGPKVVAPVRPLESRPASPEGPPPLAEGASLDISAPKPVPPAHAAPPEGRSAKPPPPHVQRGGPARAPPPAPRDEAPSAPQIVESGARVGAATVRVVATMVTKVTQRAEDPTKTRAGAAESAGHAHDDLHAHIATDEGRLSALWAAILLVLLTFVAEVYGGIVSNSLALFSDAGHTFMDLFSYGLAYAAVIMSQRRANERETFGAHRAEIVAAFLSGILLLLVVALIYVEAFGRLANPEPIDLTYMLTVPLLAVAVNLYLARRFHGARDLNMRGAHLHVLSDLLSAIGVLFGGVLILATGNLVFDPLVSFFIGLLILRGAIELLRNSAEILLERTPAHLKVPEVLAHIKETPGVAAVHSVHVWSLCSSVHALSAHIVAAPSAKDDTQALLSLVRTKVEKEFGIHFTTIQVECEDCGADQHPTVVHGVAEAVSRTQSHV